ncbi:MAG: SPW repeat-containing protein [Parcubacteria group bacterium GW2011_GWA1_60_11]|nr:MAG: SPW repeat-containing protein [Parcubacteria group bacterium GW2011_GWA1_60_11]
MKLFSWAELVLGVWVIASPWIFGFSGTLGLWSNVVAGTVFAVLAIWRIFGTESAEG